MKTTISIFTFLIFSVSNGFSQPTLKNPTICHDKNKYLKCYNDGSYILKMNKGQFTEFWTTDSTFHYNSKTRVFTFF